VRSNLWKCKAIRVLFWTHFISSVIVPFFRGWGGLDFTQIMFLNGWFMFCCFALEIPTGTVADRFGRKISVVLACPIGVAAITLFLSYPHFAVFMLAEALFAVSYTLMSGAEEALVYDSLEQLGEAHTSKRVFAQLDAYKLGGILIGALAGSVIAKQLGITMPLRAQMIPLLVAFGLALTLREPPALDGGRTRRSYRETMVEGVRLLFTNASLRQLAIDMVCVNAVVWPIILLYQGLLERAGLDLVWFGTVHAGMALIQIAVLANVERIERLVGSRRRLLVLGALTPALGYALLGVSAAIWLVVPSIMLVCALGLTRLPLFTSYMNKHLPSDVRATALSTASMLRTFAIALFNPLCGLIADHSLALTALFLAGCALLLALFSRVREEALVD